MEFIYLPGWGVFLHSLVVVDTELHNKMYVIDIVIYNIIK